MDIKYTDKKEYSTEDLQALFKSVDWLSANYPERLKKALDHCETVYTAWRGDRLVGLINAIDDSEPDCLRPLSVRGSAVPGKRHR